jgi:hypothetical protein
MRRTDLFNKKEALCLASLDEPFRTTFRIAAIAVNDALGGVGFGDIVMNIEDGYRTDAAQHAHFISNREQIADSGVWTRKRDARGRKLPIKTNADSGQSPHNYRRAAHIVLRYVEPSKKDGLRHWVDGKDGRWEIVKDKVEALGLMSGYHFKDPFDPAHVESTDWRALRTSRGSIGLKEDERLDNWKPLK